MVNIHPSNVILYSWWLIFHLDGDETGMQRNVKSAEKAKRHALSSSALQGLREEYLDTPAEIVEFAANGSRANVAREKQERQE